MHVDPTVTAAIVTVGGTLMAAWMTKQDRRQRRTEERTASTERKVAKVAEVTQTLEPNGGSSMHDGLRRVEAIGKFTVEAVERVDERQRSYAELQAAMLAQLSQHIEDAREDKREIVARLAALEMRRPRVRETRGDAA